MEDLYAAGSGFQRRLQLPHTNTIRGAAAFWWAYMRAIKLGIAPPIFWRISSPVASKRTAKASEHLKMHTTREGSQRSNALRVLCEDYSSRAPSTGFKAASNLVMMSTISD